MEMGSEYKWVYISLGYWKRHQKLIALYTYVRRVNFMMCKLSFNKAVQKNQLTFVWVVFLDSLFCSLDEMCLSFEYHLQLDSGSPSNFVLFILFFFLKN